LSVREAIAGAVLVVLVVLVFNQVTGNSFHLDDEFTVRLNPDLHPERLDLEALWRAVHERLHPRRIIPNLTFAVDWWRGGGAPEAFLQTNVAIHASTALMLFFLARGLLVLAAGLSGRQATVAAFVAAAFWAVHPIQLQAVTYIVQRMTSLAAFFVVATLYAYLRARQAPRLGAWAVVAVIFAVCAIISKENAWIIPILVLLVESLIRLHAPSRLPAVSIGLMVLVVGIVAFDLGTGGPIGEWLAAGYANRDFSLQERLLTQPRVILFYGSLLLWPDPGRFSIEHDFPLSYSLTDPWTTLPAIVALCVLYGGAAWLFMRPATRLVGFCLLWVPLTLAIESSIVPLELVFEHRVYLPSMGLFILLGFGAVRLHQRCARWRYPIVFCALGLMVLLSTSTLRRIPHWQTPFTLAEHTVVVTPGSARAWLNYALYAMQESRFEAAAAALDQVARLAPGVSLDAHRERLRARRLQHELRQLHDQGGDDGSVGARRAEIFWELGRVSDALTEIDRASKRALRPAPWLSQLALWQRSLGRHRDEALTLRRLLEHDQALDTQHRLVAALLDAGELAAAGAALDRYESRAGHDAALPLRVRWLRLHGWAASALTRLAEAVEAGREEAGWMLREQGLSLHDLGRYPAAVRAFDRALQAGERTPELRYWRARSLALSGRQAEALIELDRLLAESPYFVTAHVARGGVLQELGRKPEAMAAWLRACQLGIPEGCALAR